jgi:hypothetical protein
MYLAWAIDQLHIKIHPGLLSPLGPFGPGKERSYVCTHHSLNPFWDQLVQEGRGCTLLTLLPPGPIGQGSKRVHSAHSLPSRTNWSRKGEGALFSLFSLSSLLDQLVPEGRECSFLTLLPHAPIGPGRGRVHSAHSLPLRTNQSRKGKSLLFSLSSLQDRLVQEGREWQCPLSTLRNQWVQEGWVCGVCICRWVVCEVDYCLDWWGRNGVGLVWVAVCFLLLWWSLMLPSCDERSIRQA